MTLFSFTLCLRLLFFTFNSYVSVPEDKEIEGYVVRILDGDTFELLIGDSASVHIRLNGIDAPEKKQDFGTVSKNYLGELIFNKQVLVEIKGYDRYSRIIGDVYIDNNYINAAMIKAGLAWHYTKYSKDSDLTLYESIAKEQKIGLWSFPNPIEPWIYRKNGKNIITSEP